MNLKTPDWEFLNIWQMPKPQAGDFGGFMGLKWWFLDKKWQILTFLFVYDSENRTLGILDNLRTPKSARWRFLVILAFYVCEMTDFIPKMAYLNVLNSR